MKAFLRLLALSLLAVTIAPVGVAGPVPGVEVEDLTPVDFPTPEHIDVMEIAPGRYAVTFKWTPGRAVEKPGVAGSFNGWNREATPMDGPDEKGTYSASLEIAEGTWQYKFISGADGWHTDPHNPDKEEDNYGGANSILKLGIHAIADGVEAARGDARIELRGVLHDPKSPTFVEVFTSKDALLRLRTLKNDVESASVTINEGKKKPQSYEMTRTASDNIFDYFEYHVVRPAKSIKLDYSFTLSDGEASQPIDGDFVLNFDKPNPQQVPDWARDAIWYQIMVDRFRDGDAGNNVEHSDHKRYGNPSQTAPWTSDWEVTQPWEDDDGQSFWQWSIYNRMYGGDFAGVIEKLDYLKSLGVNAIYFNPVFDAQGSHKYNARTYSHADDGYGKQGEFWKSTEREDLLDSSTWEWNESDKLLLKLIEEAHKRDMRVVLDGVFNHIGNDNPAFVDVAKNRKSSRFADWFNVKSWEPFEYVGWAGFGMLPEFRKDGTHGIASASARQYIYDSTRRWMDPNGDGDPSDGIDGWRLDVPGDVPMPFWYEWSDLVKSINPDAYIVGEIWGPAESWLDGESFHAVMNYPFAKMAFAFFGNEQDKISASEFDNQLARHRIRYSRAVNEGLQNLYDSHDTDRWVSRLAHPDRPYDSRNRIQDYANYDQSRPGDEHYQRLRLMALFQATYVGAPMIWYGTEVGMFGADDPHCRLPMWWEDLMPYDNPEYKIDDSLREHFRELFTLRTKHEVLRRGDFTTLLTADHQDVYAYLRHIPGEKSAIAVILNNSEREQLVRIPAPSKSVLPKGFRKPKLLFGKGSAELEKKEGTLAVTLPPVSGVVVEVGR